MGAYSTFEAERAFRHLARARRRAAVLRRLRRRRDCGCLAVVDEASTARRRSPALPRGVREIPLDAVSATLEPSRARQFDGEFRPAAPARARWQRVWMAEERGAVLPPITVVQVGDRYAVRDGHHRVSVAKARGASTIDALVEEA